MKEVPFLCRVLRIQHHKYSTFLYVAGFAEARQLIIEQALFETSKIQPLSVIRGLCDVIENHAGKRVYRIVRLDSVIPSLNQKKCIEDYTNKAIAFRRCRCETISQAKDFLRGEGFLETCSPFTLPYRGTSTAQPLKVEGEYIHRYTKITHELGLKQAMCNLLSPVFEIGYVACDTYITKARWFEYTVLEFVSPLHDISFIERFIKKFIDIATENADRYKLEHRNFAALQTLSMRNEQCSPVEFASARKAVKNTIFLDAPTVSPLVKTVGGQKTETIWILDGESMAHGYCDETDWKAFYDFCKDQMMALQKKEVQGEISEDFLSVMRCGLPDSISIGMGMDRFFQKFFGIDSLKEYHRLFG